MLQIYKNKFAYKNLNAEKTLKGSRTTLTDIIDTPSESYQPIGASNLTLYGSKRSNKEQLLQVFELNWTLGT